MSDYSSNASPISFIEPDFLPIKICNNDWANQTCDDNYYKFPHHVPEGWNSMNRDNKYIQWCDIGNKLRNELMEAGMTAAVKEVRHLSKEENIINFNDSQSPINIQDVVATITTK